MAQQNADATRKRIIQEILEETRLRLHALEKMRVKTIAAFREAVLRASIDLDQKPEQS
jgi:hypothetical protein